ncbi:MAG: hypothetical protein ACLGH0_08885, partial [Thermoanaerobaculia bacterium]
MATADLLRPHLRAAQEQSAHGATIKSVAAAADIRALLADVDRSSLASLSPAELFFVFEASPETAQQVDATLVASAYCAALAIVPADWWGTPGSADTAA